MVQDDEVDFALLQFVRHVDQVLKGSAEAVEFGDDELIAGSRSVKPVVQLRSSGQFAAGLIDENTLAAGGDQGVVLGREVLVAGRNPTVAYFHLPNVSQSGVNVT